MLTVLEVIKKTTEFFSRKGIESSRLNAEVLIGHALGLKRMQLYLQFERPLTETELEGIRGLVRRRGLHEPLQYIVGETEFHGLRLRVDPRVLIPRPETEQLLEIVITQCPQPPGRVLDLGTGSGAIALALAQAFPTAEVVAVDVDAAALGLARENAAATGLSERVAFIESNWFEQAPHGPYDLIVANPPYLSAREVEEAPSEVRDFEPHRALAAESDGLADLRTIITAGRRYLAPAGLLALETGINQHAMLIDLMTGNGYSHAESRRDLSGRDRFIFGRC
jgi:release factor glutamine methyltransferase